MSGRHHSHNPTRWFRLLPVIGQGTTLVPTQVRVSPPSCREPSGLLPTRRGVTKDAPFLRASWEPLPPGASTAVLVGRATHVPQAAVTSGIQRTVTVNLAGPISWSSLARPA